MYSIIEDYFFFWQIIDIKKKFSNTELKFYQLFYKITKTFPVNIIIKEAYIFFFVNNQDYFKSKQYIRKLRSMLKNKKIIILREESTLIRLLFSFFQDTNIYDIILGQHGNSDKKLVRILYCINKDRAIAIGNNGVYIKTINFLFNNYINFRYYNNIHMKIPMEIRCETIKKE
ncbi:MAG: hypothetical protein ACFFBW_03480 [Promethearchaeota archaeon]